MTEMQSDAVEPAVVRQSFRCFWLGLVGLIPAIGVAVAWQSLLNFRQVCTASGERIRVAFPITLFLGLCALIPLMRVGFPEFADFVVSIAVVGVFVVWIASQYFASHPTRWNPARSWAWAGAALAAIGIATTVIALELVYVGAYGRILRGLQ